MSQCFSLKNYFRISYSAAACVCSVVVNEEVRDGYVTWSVEVEVLVQAYTGDFTMKYVWMLNVY